MECLGGEEIQVLLNSVAMNRYSYAIKSQGLCIPGLDTGPLHPLHVFMLLAQNHIVLTEHSW